MKAAKIAVLSYHGWEIDPDRLVDDVSVLRAAGWSELSLDDLEATLSRGGRAGRHFHVTIDDGAEQDRDCVAALRALSCPVTLFLSLDAMTETARLLHRELASCSDVVLGDHSLRHNRTFHYRHIVGFHSDAAPYMTSAEQLGLQTGDPVCMYGAELARCRFVPDGRANELCRRAAKTIRAASGSAAWHAALAARLVESGLGFRRLGRLCVAGTYESRDAFRDRVTGYLVEGSRRFAEFTGRAARAFAHPWWEASAVADDCLRALGYRLTFSGRGLYCHGSAFHIPRLFVGNSTPRPIDPYVLAQAGPSAVVSRLRDIGRRTLFA